MALQGSFVLNGANYAPFDLYGVGVFMAFSGNGFYRNNVACVTIPNNGPIPPGRYWIVERGAGGIGSWVKARSLDLVNKIFYGAEFGRDEWFALYRDDGSIDDTTWINGVSRGLFRLHPGRISEGCITIVHNSDYALIRNALLRTTPMQVPRIESLKARGWIEVIAHDYKNICPKSF